MGPLDAPAVRGGYCRAGCIHESRLGLREPGEMPVASETASERLQQAKVGVWVAGQSKKFHRRSK